MAPKAPKTAFHGGHTSGIYADMTVDGPDIGTLVLIVDRAKNLPNRRTMGKQDPYCAARLGKEAKKTETDRRGGQTPKWDQELRFTVHDSPDYYQLKVSIFNDDKKTELIGETFIRLEDVIVPGGGKDDQWHSLHCKGRFAGEIRIELTYYDTRPRKPKSEDCRPSESLVAPEQRETSGGVGGPRQAKPPKRRPLPADPTLTPYDQPNSEADSTYAPHHQQQQQRALPYQWSASDLRQSTNVVESLHPDDREYQSQSGQKFNQYPGRQDSSAIASNPHVQPQDSRGRVINDYYVEPQLDEYGDSGHVHTQADLAQDRRDASRDPALQYQENFTGRYVTSPMSLRSDIRHNSAPVHSTPQVNSRQEAYSPHSPAENPSNLSDQGYGEPSDWRQHAASRSELYNGQDDQEGPPPPPPTHRYSGGVSPLEPRSSRHSDIYPPVTGPAPLNIRNGRGTVSASPLSQVQATHSHQPYSSRPSQHPARPPAHSLSSSPSNFSYDQPDRRSDRRSPSPIRDPFQATPPSLKAGYDPRVADDESERASIERRMQDQRQSEPAPHYQAFSTHDTQRRAHPSPTRNQKPDQLRFLEDNHPRTTHRASAPLPYIRNRSPEAPQMQPVGHVSPSARTSQRQSRSPDPRIPMRKSVSPQPIERRQSAVPFSPDSYESFNPTLSAATGMNPASPRYDTPDQAREVSTQPDRESKQPEGPIIGNDGRVIDPSDHLPTDTWAPEPETKAPRKAAEVTVRFRRGPQGAQPLPTTARRPHLETTGRPHSISTPPSALASENVSPASSTGAKLQKRGRNLPAHPASSPTVPTIHTAARGSPLRNQSSNTPLREHEHYGYNNQNPYPRNSPSGGAPPIPDKIPPHAEHEDWNTRALSEEMSRIDIGVGGGARARRSRYGM